MHHLIVKSNFVEGKTTKLGYHGGEGKNNVPVCPKPRRPRSTNPREVLKPFKCTNAHRFNVILSEISFLVEFLFTAPIQSNLDGRSEILSMIITDKVRSCIDVVLLYFLSKRNYRDNLILPIT
ncbi:hypothetical protein Tco_0097521 [Tanacetum coccineum]